MCSRIEHLTSEVEGEALSALDALTKKVLLGLTSHVMPQEFLFHSQNHKFTHILKALQVSKHTLEHVRRVKNCMMRLNARAEALHDLLEKLVDSDMHMRDMILTAKPQVWAAI